MSQNIYPQEDAAQEPRDQTGGPSEEQPIHYLEPQYTLIDDRYTEAKEGAQTTNGSQSAKSPLTLRFLCFLGLIFCSIFGLGMVLMAFLSTVLSTCYLFRNAQLNDSMCHFWKLATHTLVAGSGCILGLISPTIGLGLIVFYFTVTGEINDTSLLHTFLKRSFDKF